MTLQLAQCHLNHCLDKAVNYQELIYVIILLIWEKNILKWEKSKNAKK